jgi:hypothetical protein
LRALRPCRKYCGRPTSQGSVSLQRSQSDVATPTCGDEALLCVFAFSRAPPALDFADRALVESTNLSPFCRTTNRLQNVRHVHRSPRHRGRRAFPPLRFVCPPAALRGRALERGGDRSWLGCILWGPADGVGRSRLGAARPQVPFLWNARVWSAGIGLVLAPALPNQIALTAPSGPPTSSTAARTTLKRGPASSITCILPCVIVAVALSRLAGSSPLALRPCMAGSGGGASWTGRPIAPHPHFMSLAVQASLQLSGWSLR